MSSEQQSHRGPQTSQPSSGAPSTSRSEPLPVVGDARPTPVFDCRVILSRDEAGRLHARCANLPGPEASGSIERDVLRNIVGQFKQLMEQYAASGEPVPWKTPPEVPGDGESQRWIPVHL